MFVSLQYNLFAKYLRPHTYTIIHQHRSTELADNTTFGKVSSSAATW